MRGGRVALASVVVILAVAAPLLALDHSVGRTSLPAGSAPRIATSAALSHGSGPSNSYRSPAPSVVPPGSRPVTLFPTRSASSGSSSWAGAASQRNCYQPRTCGDVVWHGGDVMHNVSVKLIYWLPNGSCPTSNSSCFFDNAQADPCVRHSPCSTVRDNREYENVVNGFFHALGSSAFYSVLQQYGDLFGSPGPYNDLNATSGVTVATDPLPGGRGSLAHPLTISDLDNEINVTLQRTGWGPGLNVAFLLFTPYQVNSCAGNYIGTCVEESFQSFCAFHDSYSYHGQSLIYADLPDVGTANCGVGSLPTPNGDPFADGEINVAAHELFEAVSDPFGTAWWDSTTGAEIADECAWHFGPVAVDGADVSLGGTFRSFVQYVWSNDYQGCWLPPPLTIRAAGLPIGSAWSVDSGSPRFLVNNTTVGLRGTIVVLDDTSYGSWFRVTYAIGPPAGFGLARITGHPHPNQTVGVVVEPSTIFTAKFGPLETLYFNESGSSSSRLPAGTPWSVVLDPKLLFGGPPRQVVSTNGSSIVFVVPAGSVYTFSVRSSTTSYAAGPAQGSFHVPHHAFGRVVRFAPVAVAPAISGFPRLRGALGPVVGDSTGSFGSAILARLTELAVPSAFVRPPFPMVLAS